MITGYIFTENEFGLLQKKHGNYMLTGVNIIGSRVLILQEQTLLPEASDYLKDILINKELSIIKKDEIELPPINNEI